MLSMTNCRQSAAAVVVQPTLTRLVSVRVVQVIDTASLLRAGSRPV